MPKIPTYHSKIKPPTHTGQAPLPRRAAYQGEAAIGAGMKDLGQGIGQVGDVLARIKLEQIALNDQINLAKISSLQRTSERDLNTLNQQTELEFDESGVSTWEKNEEESWTALEQQVKGFSLSRNAQAKLGAQMEMERLERQSIVRGNISTSLIKTARTALPLAVEDAYASGNQKDIDIALKNFEDARSKTWGARQDLADVALRSAVADGAKRYKEGVVENIKPLLISAIQDGNKENGYEILDKTTKQLVDAEILTQAEAAEANKKLGDWMDLYVAGRFKEVEESIKQTYSQLCKKAISGNLSYEDVEFSELPTKDKELWNSYIKGSADPAPSHATQDGHNALFAAVYDAATLRLSPKEAYDVLLELRYKEKEITDEQFEWGVNKIEKPYQRHVLEDINTTMIDNNNEHGTLFRGERNKKTNESLLSWIDSQIADGKTPTKEDMFAMSSQFRVGDDRWFNVGQVIERGGIRYEVVGFKDNGEPLFEIVE